MTVSRESPPGGAAAVRDAVLAHLREAAAGDQRAVLAGYDPDAMLHAPDGELRGREAIGRWFASRAGFFTRLSLRVERLDVTGTAAALNWWGQFPSGARLEGVDQFRVSAAGLITEQRVVRVGRTERDARHVRLEVVPPVAHLVLDRAEKRNAVSQAMLRVLTATLAELGADDRVGAVVLRGEGPDFCAGEDVRGFRFPDTTAARDFLAGPFGLFTAIETLPKPVVVAVHGHTLGFGAEVLLVADAVIAGTGATIGFAEVDHGAVPSVLVTRGLGSIRRRQAIELALTGRRLTARQAWDMRLVHEVVDDPLAVAERRAHAMAALPQSPVRVVKTLLGADAADDHGRAREFMPSVLTQVRVAL